MGYALYIIKHIKVKEVITNKGKDNKLEKTLFQYLEKEKKTYRKVAQEKIKIGDITIYSLNQENKENENKDSLILYTKIKKYNILFMGDADKENEKYIMDAYNLPKMDILKIGHHGASTSSSLPFLEKVKPTYSLISVGKKNKYNHPSKQVLLNLNKVNSKVYQTSTHNMVEIILSKKPVIRSLQR